MTGKLHRLTLGRAGRAVCRGAWLSALLFCSCKESVLLGPDPDGRPLDGPGAGDTAMAREGLASGEARRPDAVAATDLAGSPEGATPGARTYYLSPTGSDDTGNGTMASPWFSLNKAWAAVAAGDLIYLRGGTYQITEEQRLHNKSGTAGARIKIWAYPKEQPRITRHASYAGSRGIYLSGANFLHLKGLEIFGFSQTTSSAYYYGIMGYDVNDSIFEGLDVHHNGFGLSIGSVAGTATGNLFLSSDFHHNSDPISSMGANGLPWGGADGLSVRTAGNGVNTIDGCRMWMNSDDGFDCYDNEGDLVFKNSWAFWNGYRPGASVGDPDQMVEGGDGNGFKLGPLKASADKSGELKRTISGCLAFENRAMGFDQNVGLCIMKLVNNTAYDNSVGFGFGFGTIAHILRNNVAYKNDQNIGKVPAWVHDHNTWNGVVTVTDADFASLSSSGMDGARQANGDLPVLPFLRLAAGSDLINAGVDVGLPYGGSAPDLGAFEYP